MHSSPPDRLNIFPVGGPFWESYSKALHGASKTSLVRRIQKNYETKHTSSTGDILQGNPCSLWGLWNEGFPETMRIQSLVYSSLIIYGGSLGRWWLRMGLTLASLVVCITIIFLWVILFYFPMGNFKQKRKKKLMLLNGVKGRNVKQQQPNKGKPESFLWLQQSEKFK